MSYTNPGPKYDLSAANPCYPLASGVPMPVVAYGTFRSKPGEVQPAVIDAIKVGYRHFDLAHVYGNEKEVGAAFKQAFDEGLVKREDLFITGKLWNSDHDVEVVPKACDTSLNDLGLDYFDLYLIHFPIATKHISPTTPSLKGCELGTTPMIDTWRAMEKLVDAGKCKSLGVSNFPLMFLNDLVNQVRIPVSCNQIETHVYYTRESLVNYCLSRNIAVTAHTPLGGGTTNKDTWNVMAPMDDPVVKKIAESHGKSPAQVLLRFLLQRGVVVLPKSVKKHRMEQNRDVFDFTLSADDMKALMGLDKYFSAKTNPNPQGGFRGGCDQFTEIGTDIFD